MRKESFATTLLKLAAAIFVSLTTITVFFISLGVVLSILFGVLGTVLGDKSETLPPQYKTIYGARGDKLLSLRVNGIILGERDEAVSPLDVFVGGVTYGYDLKEQFMDAAEDDSIKGIVLEINSPGGTIYGSRSIADGVAYYQEKTKKPVIASISGLGASGGYWVAASTDAIFADYGSTLGSIGVLFGPFQYYNKVLSVDGGALIGGVVTQNGIETTYFTAGKSKDIGSPYRQLTQDEVTQMQQSVHNEYDEFVSFISTRRKIPEQQLRDRIGAMIYENKRAQELRLINGTKNKQDAYEELAKRAGIDGEFYVVGLRQEPALAQLLFESVLKNRLVPSVNSCPAQLFSTVLVYFGDLTLLCK
ncbi:MAG: S49 family peptidase [Candidatus Levybacteria bacterium]|nr:S49 family peptidase [Candidatus Levybacteria bacterium]